MFPHPLRTLITLGPTHEPMDAVRYLGNRSSGRMGVAIAKALERAGCHVHVLAGPCQPVGIDSLPRVERFRTAEQLRGLLASRWPGHDMLVMAAAVADWRPANPVTGKARRRDDPLTLSLEPVPEILGSLASRPDQFVTGFALEPREELIDSARRKLERKRADCIVANPLETMDAIEIEATLIWPDGRQERPEEGRLDKQAFAAWLVDRLLPAARARCAR
jgi:phosphopantothenoylcysteine decarboxylase/phosphopantothenate--cysteine ligase